MAIHIIDADSTDEIVNTNLGDTWIIKEDVVPAGDDFLGVAIDADAGRREHRKANSTKTA